MFSKCFSVLESRINQNVQTILREFLGLPNTGEEEAFPHENKTTNTGTIRKSDSHELWPIIYRP